MLFYCERAEVQISEFEFSGGASGVQNACSCGLKRDGAHVGPLTVSGEFLLGSGSSVLSCSYYCVDSLVLVIGDNSLRSLGFKNHGNLLIKRGVRGNGGNGGRKVGGGGGGGSGGVGNLGVD